MPPWCRRLRLLERDPARGARARGRSRVLPSGGSRAGSPSGSSGRSTRIRRSLCRILVDVAIRALSPAVNDPTTAVQVIDHLEDTLALIGTHAGARRTLGVSGRPALLRLVMPAHRFDDLLSLACHGDPRVREHLDPGAPPAPGRTPSSSRCPCCPSTLPFIRDELERLDLTTRTGFGGTPDAEQAAGADRQGIGGPPPLVAAATHCQRPHHALGFARGCSPRTRRGVLLRARGDPAAKGRPEPSDDLARRSEVADPPRGQR